MPCGCTEPTTTTRPRPPSPEALELQRRIEARRREARELERADRSSWNWYWIPQLQRRQKFPAHVAKRFRFPLADDQTDPPEPAGGCESCEAVELVLWPSSGPFRALYYGVPKFNRPIRFRRRFPFVELEQLPGCGCHKLTKDLVRALGMTWRAVRRRHRLQVDALLNRPIHRPARPGDHAPRRGTTTTAAG